MNLEVFRVDPTSKIPLNTSWQGYTLREQRHPVTGDGWQLWAIRREDDRPTSRILDGMPITKPHTDALALVRDIIEGGPAITEPAVTWMQATEFVLDIGYAGSSTLVGTRWVGGILGAVMKASADAVR